jgi:hypothetical protein
MPPEPQAGLRMRAVVGLDDFGEGRTMEDGVDAAEGVVVGGRRDFGDGFEEFFTKHAQDGRGLRRPPEELWSVLPSWLRASVTFAL